MHIADPNAAALSRSISALSSSSAAAATAAARTFDTRRVTFSGKHEV